MGCFVSRETLAKNQSLQDLNSGTIRGTFIGTQLFLGNMSREISNVSEFRLGPTDFVGEKTGEIHNEYSLLYPPIGKGAYGEVWRAIHKRTNITRAIKVVYKDRTDEEEQQRLINEVNILKTLDHPNIMKVIEFYQDENYFYIVNEFLNGGELFEKITQMKHFSERRAAKTIKQIVSAIHYCHQLSIVHRDLKPENILYESKSDDALLKVIDFGTSRFFDASTKMRRKSGSPYYIAPEVIKRNYSANCDIWSCGVILYILLCGNPPFNGDTNEEIMDQVLIGKYDFSAPEWTEVSDAAQHLISKMMEYNPQDRYSADQVLNDPWFKTVLGDSGEDNFDKPLTVSALGRLSRFKTDRKLQEAIWSFLVSYTSTKEEWNRMYKIFQSLDLNGDGTLSRDELITGYKQMMGVENPEVEVDAIIRTVDYNNSGTLEYSEFIMATIDKQNMLSKDRLDTVFKLIDKDGSGFIDVDELKQCLNPGNQIEIDDQVWSALIQEVDTDGDGQISHAEFTDMMLRLLKD